MPKIHKSYQDQKREELNMPVYTTEDFKQLETELDKYCIDKELTISGESRMVRYVPKEGMVKWFNDNGATNEEFAIRDISKFKLLQDKLDQYYNWIRRKEFASRMQYQNYESIVGSVVDRMEDF